MLEVSWREDVRATVEDLCRALVDNEAAVQVDALESDQLTVFEVRADGSDHGKLIGRHGRTADALRQILLAVSGALDHRFTIEFLEPDRSVVVSESQCAVRTHVDPVRLASVLLEQETTLLVDVADAVQIKSVRGTQVVLFDVLTPPMDVPRIVGRSGRNAAAIREILHTIGSRYALRFLLEVLEPDMPPER